MRHHGIGIYAIRTRHDHNAHWIFMICFITNIFYHRQFFRSHLLGDLRNHFGWRGLVRQGADNDFPVFFLPCGAHFDSAATLLIYFANFFFRRNDFRLCREIRALYHSQQIIQGRFRIIQQHHCSIGDFINVMRRNIRCHPHRDPCCAVE